MLLDMKTANCKNCNKEFEYKWSGRGNSCSKECTAAIVAKSKLKYTDEQIQFVITLKKEGKTNNDIVAASGVKLSKVKEIVKDNNVLLTPEERHKHAYEAKLAKNPLAMEQMRSKITEESYEKASVTKKQTFASDPKYHDIFSNIKKEMWEDLRSDPIRYKEYIEGRSITQRETKLGMSLEKYEELLLIIKKEVEDKKETITSASEKYGLSFVTTLRQFHKHGWSDLISSFVSKAQLDIYNYVKSITDQYILLNDRTGLRGTELDVYMPKSRFGIEFNGLYWHSSASDQFKKMSHAKKAQKCKEGNVNLLAIFEDEWANETKQELIKKMIAYRLGVLKTKTLSPRKLDFRLLTSNAQFKDFFEKHHIDGHTTASFAYGFFYGEELVFCASFRTNFNKELEIARLASNYDYSVPGALGKILKKINQTVVSYSNNRLSHGNIYIQNGFVEITKTNQPSYWYTDLKTRVWRFKCKRNNDPAIIARFPTEQIQAEAGIFSQKLFGDYRPLYRIEDYGHRKWLWTPKN